MDPFSDLILPDGSLDLDKVVSYELIDQTEFKRKSLIRFTIDTSQGLSSFIYKPSSNPATVGRERWVANHLLPMLPVVRSPKLIKDFISVNREQSWAIYEDLGKLEHRLDPTVREKAARVIPNWHQVDVNCLPEEFREGTMPYIDDALNEVKNRWSTISDLILSFGVPTDHVHLIEHEIQLLNHSFPTELVVSHGDFHPLNIALCDDQLIVLDWELIRPNSVYWDLYNLIDISMPRFHNEVDKTTRKRVLHAYLAKRQSMGWQVQPDQFFRNYHLYAAIYSMYIALLIDHDRSTNQYGEQVLQIKQSEVRQVLLDCVEYWRDNPEAT